MRKYATRNVYYVCDKITMEIVCTCYDVYEAVKYFPSMSVRSLPICAETKSVPKGKYVLRKKSNYNVNETYEGKANRPLKAKIGDNWYAWWDIEALAKRIGTTKTTLQYSANHARPLQCGLVFEYAR